MTSEQRTICHQPPHVGSAWGADCPDCGHNNLLHSRSQPCEACVLRGARDQLLRERDRLLLPVVEWLNRLLLVIGRRFR